MTKKTNATINPLLIGQGYWGKNILRNLIENQFTGSVSLCDSNPDKLINFGYPKFPIQRDVDSEKAILNPSVDVVLIATPASTHFTLAKQALLNDKHVLVEKPFCTSVSEAKELCDIARERDLVLMVDHIYLYNPIVRQLKSFIEDASYGKINYIDSTRINLGIYQKDTNVLWDLACHDIYIVNFLISEKPIAVRTIGRINPLHSMEDIVYLYLYYPSGLLVHINSSWASPVKLRKMIIGGEKRMIIYDDIEPTNKLTIYDYGQIDSSENNKSFLIDYRLGNITIPKCDIQEPLRNVIEAFYDAVLNKTKTVSDGSIALETVQILEAAQKSLAAGGAKISLL